MNDIVLSSLLNLFALFGADRKLDKKKSLSLISDYLSHSFGIRNPESYLNLYNELRDFYDSFPSDDTGALVEGICSKLRGRVSKANQGSMMLRLLEFSALTLGELPEKNAILDSVAASFGVSENSYRKYTDFINGTESDSVRIIPLPSDAGSLKTLYLKGHKTIIFSYLGNGGIFMNDVPVKPGVFQVWKPSDILKSKLFSPLYYSTVVAAYEDDSAKEKIHLQGRDINFRFAKGGDNGMHNFSFDLKGGELVAIMGGSGVGKTTLLSLLNGSLRPQSGTITINGHDILEPEAKALIGFVPQDDLLIEELTVYENLYYTAKLCFAGLSEEEIDGKVISILTQLGLEQAKDLKVGSPLNKYISGGQRKRLNIALELIREPAVLFLDEPTSGLSSSDTEKVVGLLKEQTGRGKLIVTNIHQPSSDVYKLFDRLWLLDKGGYPVFDGNPIDAIAWFKSAADYADAYSTACPVCGNVNPEVVLNIIDEKALDATGHITEERKIKPQEWHELYLKARPEMAGVEVEKIPDTDQKRPGALRQMLIFLRRNFSAKITNLQYILVTLLEAPALAAICGLLTHYAPEAGKYTVMDNKNLVSYFFMAIIVSIFLGMAGSAEEIIKDRALLKREKFLSLSYGSYIWSKILYMSLVCLVQTLLFTVVGNLIMGISGTFWIWWMVLFISAFLSSLIGLLLSQCLNSVVAIYITIPLLLIPQILLCGLVVHFEDLNPGSKTGNVPVIGDVIPSRWAFEALAVANFADNEYESMFYEKDRIRYEALYFEKSFAYELESQVETRQNEISRGIGEKPVHLAILRNELPRLADVCEMEPYSGDWSYDSLIDYIDRAKSILSSRGNKTALSIDRDMNGFIREYGFDKLKNLKRDNYNIQLENLVLNRETTQPYRIVEDRIVPHCGYIFLKPQSRNGRAPFYSGVKIVGNTEIPTLWFNMGVLLFMCILLVACLLTDIPGKYVRKEKN